MDLTLLGTIITNGTQHEGRSGWQTLNYTTMANHGTGDGSVNAFWNPNTSNFDFAYYMTQQAYASVDYVIINLGINDVFTFNDDISLNAEIPNILARYQSMIDSIKVYNANVKIGVAITIAPSSNQDSFGDNYGNNKSQWRYKRNNILFVNALINNFKGEEAQGIYLVPINTNIDTTNNMHIAQVEVNSRNPLLVTRQINGLHPDSIGYYQIADVFYYWLKSFES